MSDTPPPDAARRNFLRGSAVSGASIGLLSGCAPMAAASAAAGRAVDAERTATTTTAANVPAGARATIHLTVNSRPCTLTVEPGTTLVEALRDTLGMTGTKIGCNHGQCGDCTVLVDGRRSNSCLMLAVAVDGARITTIEGLAGPGGALHPMQLAFAETDAFQCGYCTPGQIVSAVACITEGHAGSAAEIREYMSGNLCRCAAYRRAGNRRDGGGGGQRDPSRNRQTAAGAAVHHEGCVMGVRAPRRRNVGKLSAGLWR